MSKPQHLKELEEEINQLEDAQEKALWDYWQVWPDWLPDEMKNQHDNPGLTLNRLDIMLERKKTQYFREQSMWLKLTGRTNVGG